MAQSGIRVLVAGAAVVSGLAIGLLLVAIAGGGDNREPAPYQPFFAGFEERIRSNIERDGPIFYSDPTGGEKAFYLDVDSGEIVALHIVPAGVPSCPVEWDRERNRYVDCEGDEVERGFLPRFPVTTEPRDGRDGVFVDLRRLEPAPAGARPSDATTAAG